MIKGKSPLLKMSMNNLDNQKEAREQAAEGSCPFRGMHKRLVSTNHGQKLISEDEKVEFRMRVHDIDKDGQRTRRVRVKIVMTDAGNPDLPFDEGKFEEMLKDFMEQIHEFNAVIDSTKEVDDE